GNTGLIGIRARVLFDDGTHVRPRGIRVTTGGQAFYQSSDGRDSSRGKGFSGTVSGRIPGSDGWAPVGFVGGFDWETERGRAMIHTGRDIRRQTAGEYSQEMRHNIKWVVEIFLDKALRELFAKLTQTAKLVPELFDLLADHVPSSAWHKHFPAKA